MSFCPKCGARYRGPTERPGSKCPLDDGSLEAEGQAPDPKDPLIGRQLGAYTVLAPFADGQSSRLFLAKSDEGAEVILKVVDGDLCKDRELAARYASAASLAELRDPEFFVKVLGSGTTEAGLIYVAMERFQGKTLERRLAEGPIFDIEGAEIAAGVAEALATLHRRARGHGAIEPRKVALETLPEDGTFRVRLLDASAARAKLPPLSPPPSPEDDMKALGALIRRMVDGTPGIPILALAARLESADQDKGLSHADAFLAALSKKGSGVMLSRPPTPAASSDSALPSERPTRAPSRRPSSVTVPPPVVGVGRGRVAVAVLAGAVFVVLFWAIAGRDDPAAEHEQDPTPPAVTPRAVVKSAPSPEAPVAVEPPPPPPQTPPAPIPAVAADAAIEARFAELDAELGDALRARGLGFEDLSAVEANLTRRWGRWFKKTERPTIEQLESTHRELVGAIDRAAKAKAARLAPLPVTPKKPSQKKPTTASTEPSRTSTTSRGN